MVWCGPQHCDRLWHATLFFNFGSVEPGSTGGHSGNFEVTLADLGGLHKADATPAPTDSVPLHSFLQLSVRTQQPGVQILPPETGGVPESKGRPDKYPNGA